MPTLRLTCLCFLLRRVTASQPKLSGTTVISAADLSGEGVAPGEIVVLHPSNAGPAVLVGAQLKRRRRSGPALRESRRISGIRGPHAIFMCWVRGLRRP
jgi:hypothetical protein